MKAARAPILAVLAMLLLAMPASALSRDQYFCRMMGRLVDGCCCKVAASHRNAPAGSTPEIKAQNCCQRVERAARAAASTLRDNALQIRSPLVATAPPIASFVTEPELHAPGFQPARARAPPPRRQRIFISNCSLLT